MRRFLVELQYNGKAYDGWQAQPNRRTVQGAVNDALAKLFCDGVQAVGCSRTDAGVSAEQFFFHFDADTKLPAERVAFKLNRFLPKDVQAQGSVEVRSDFHARHSALSKTYEYAFYASAHLMPLVNPHAVHVKEKIDLATMREAAQMLVGTHDFAAFTTPNAECNGTTRTVSACQIVQDGALYRFRITADGFLHKMMRNLAGFLIAVGTGALAPDTLATCFATGKRAKWLTLPPKGLRLCHVAYAKP